MRKTKSLKDIDNSAYIEAKRRIDERQTVKRRKASVPRRNPQPSIQMNINDAISVIENIPIQKIDLSKVKLEWIDPEEYNMKNAADALVNLQK